MKVLVCLVASLLAASVSADGKFMGLPVSDPKLVNPDQPYQRAVDRFRGGEETLIVESFVTAQGQDLAWNLPVPAKPKSVEAVSSGSLQTF